MQAIKEQDWQMLPESAQQEVYNFFVSIKQGYEQQKQQAFNDEAETRAFSNHTANTIDEWLDEKEDGALNQSKMTRLKALKVDSFIPLCRDDIHVR